MLMAERGRRRELFAFALWSRPAALSVWGVLLI
jgi:hypothetical protein